MEQVFKDLKEKYGMRDMSYQGLKRVGMWIRLEFTAINLKKTGNVEVERLSFKLVKQMYKEQ